MTKELIEETKKAIGYTDEVKSCLNCSHCSEIENPNLDRDWYLICKVNSLCSFTVESYSSCNLFTKKTTP